MARCHDYAEAITGDHVPGDITPKQKRSDEDEAYAQFCSQHFARGSVIRDLCIEYRNDKTPNARLVKDADKFQRLDQANIYREKFPNLNFKRFQPDANLIRDPELKEKADDIVRTWRSADLQHVKCVFVVGGYFLL
jgi:putative hydrolase of HD superfamily